MQAFSTTVLLLLALAFGLLFVIPVTAQSVSAGELITLVNGLRMGNGLPPLVADSYLFVSAQNTADTMAANNIQWHIGNVSGRVSSFGYNNGHKSFATENFAVGLFSLAQIQESWADQAHMIPMMNPAYCHIGAGVSKATNGLYTYVVHAAYPADVNACSYIAKNQATPVASGGNSETAGASYDLSQIIAAVKVSEPDVSGAVIHLVEQGQSLWAIAAAYKVNLEALTAWNNIKDTTALSIGQKLNIPTGTSLQPTAAMETLPTMNVQSEFIHTVSEGQTLWAIAELWKISLTDLLRINGITEDAIIGLDWRLRIPVTPTITPLPTSTLNPTDTPQPILMDTPIASLSETIEPTPKNSFGMSMPVASGRTYALFGVFLGAIMGAVAYVIFRFTKKR